VEYIDHMVCNSSNSVCSTSVLLALVSSGFKDCNTYLSGYFWLSTVTMNN